VSDIRTAGYKENEVFCMPLEEKRIKAGETVFMRSALQTETPSGNLFQQLQQPLLAFGPVAQAGLGIDMPAGPTERNCAPQASAQWRARSALIQGSLSLPTTKAGYGSRWRTAALTLNLAGSAGATSRPPRWDGQSPSPPAGPRRALHGGQATEAVRHDHRGPAIARQHFAQALRPGRQVGGFPVVLLHPFEAG
jgi:hypothetical protein